MPSTYTQLAGAIDYLVAHYQEQPDLDRLAAKFGVGVIRGPDGATEITHNLRTALFAADGTLVTMYPGSEWTPRTVLSDLRAHLAR